MDRCEWDFLDARLTCGIGISGIGGNTVTGNATGLLCNGDIGGALGCFPLGFGFEFYSLRSGMIGGEGRGCFYDLYAQVCPFNCEPINPTCDTDYELSCLVFLNDFLDNPTNNIELVNGFYEVRFSAYTPGCGGSNVITSPPLYIAWDDSVGVSASYNQCGPEDLSQIARGSMIPGITATGTNLATAFPLPSRGDQMAFDVQVTPSGSGVLLPQEIQCPTLVYVRNSGASTLLVYPPSGGTIAGSSSPASVISGSVLALLSLSAVDWVVP